ncbi:hypothetical protein ACQP00_15470 [Dactylosporangium sp. CS-047395]|uniref:hypothetical protein n=1 Tax=Dactylosporangium sp. CS-047395 TaxID=3239936 RepID=UPI003D8CB972
MQRICAGGDGFVDEPVFTQFGERDGQVADEGGEPVVADRFVVVRGAEGDEQVRVAGVRPA